MWCIYVFLKSGNSFRDDMNETGSDNEVWMVGVHIFLHFNCRIVFKSLFLWIHFICIELHTEYAKPQKNFIFSVDKSLSPLSRLSTKKRFFAASLLTVEKSKFQRLPIQRCIRNTFSYTIKSFFLLLFHIFSVIKLCVLRFILDIIISELKDFMYKMIQRIFTMFGTWNTRNMAFRIQAKLINDTQNAKL